MCANLRLGYLGLNATHLFSLFKTFQRSYQQKISFHFLCILDCDTASFTAGSCSNLTFSGHSTRVGSLAFHPHATVSLSPSCANMASCDADGVVKLWNMERYAVVLCRAFFLQPFFCARVPDSYARPAFLQHFLSYKLPW